MKKKKYPPKHKPKGDSIKEGWMPLRTFTDSQKWIEKSVNDMGETPTSIAQGKARIACVNALKGLLSVAINYQKLTGEKGRVKELDDFVQIRDDPKAQLEHNPGEG